MEWCGRQCACAKRAGLNIAATEHWRRRTTMQRFLARCRSPNEVKLTHTTSPSRPSRNEACGPQNHPNAITMTFSPSAITICGQSTIAPCGVTYTPTRAHGKENIKKSRTHSLAPPNIWISSLRPYYGRSDFTNSASPGSRASVSRFVIFLARIGR